MASISPKALLLDDVPGLTLQPASGLFRLTSWHNGHGTHDRSKNFAALTFTSEDEKILLKVESSEALDAPPRRCKHKWPGAKLSCELLAFFGIG